MYVDDRMLTVSREFRRVVRPVRISPIQFFRRLTRHGGAVAIIAQQVCYFSEVNVGGAGIGAKSGNNGYSESDWNQGCSHILPQYAVSRENGLQG